MKNLKYLSLLFAAGLLAGCASSTTPRQAAPVFEDDANVTTPSARTNTNRNRTTKRRAPAPILENGAVVDDNLRNAPAATNTPHPQFHRVKKGDTLYSVARQYNVDRQDIADLNDLPDNASLRPGQQLVLPVDDTTQPDVVVSKPRAAVPLKTQPRIRTNYTDAPAPVTPPRRTTAASCPNAADESLQFIPPSEGEIISGFSEADGQKGIDFVGDFGQPVLASAAGEVVYSSSGLRGYGKLVLIKHNSTYITAYAHNSKLLVKQGQQVEQGEQIAEMGNTDTNRVKLHFEIRKCSKAVDPAKYLQLN